MLSAIIVAVAFVGMLVWFVRRAPHYRTFALAASFVASGFWTALAIGFRLHEQRAPAGLDEGLLPAAAVLIITTMFGLRALWRNRITRVASFTLPRVLREQPQEMAERATWIEQMKADPQRRRYAELIEQGDSFWSPNRVEYDLNPNATTCCAHLNSIETAMRHASVRVRMSMQGAVDADCFIDAALLERKFALADSVQYEELVAYDRSLEDPPQARLSCHACDSRIWVVHPSQAGGQTPVFPRS